MTGDIIAAPKAIVAELAAASRVYWLRCEIPTQRYQFSPSSGQDQKKATVGEAFIKGLLSVDWLSCAASLPGKAINVALALLWLHGMAQSGSVKMTRKTLERFRISRDAYLDALCRLESARLVDVQ